MCALRLRASGRVIAELHGAGAGCQVGAIDIGLCGYIGIGVYLRSGLLGVAGSRMVDEIVGVGVLTVTGVPAVLGRLGVLAVPGAYGVLRGLRGLGVGGVGGEGFGV
ncbi:hypothetical protein AAH991_40150, partial [Microbispora sp. ZYX-F-249]